MKKQISLTLLTLVFIFTVCTKIEAKGGGISDDPSSLIGGTTVYQGVDYSAEYDPLTYYTLNPDLQAVFGTDAKALIRHYAEYGKKEGRIAIVSNATGNPNLTINANATANTVTELSALASIDKKRLAGFALNTLIFSFPSMTLEQIAVSDIYYTPANIAGHSMVVIVTPTGLSGKYQYLYTEALVYNRVPPFDQYWNIGNNLYIDTQIFSVDPLGEYLYSMEKFSIKDVGDSFEEASRILDDMAAGRISLVNK